MHSKTKQNQYKYIIVKTWTIQLNMLPTTHNQALYRNPSDCTQWQELVIHVWNYTLFSSGLQ